jgi:hypothetical protein
MPEMGRENGWIGRDGYTNWRYPSKCDYFRMRRENEPAGAGDAARELRRARVE